MNVLMLTTAAAAATPQVSAGAALARIAGSLILVLLVIVALAWLVRRLPTATRGKGASVTTEAGLRLGARERLVIVNVEGRRLLLGVASGHINLLTELDARDDNDFDSALNAALHKESGV